MSANNSNNRNRRSPDPDPDPDNGNNNTASYIGLAAAGIAGIAGAIFWATRGKTAKETNQANNQDNSKQSDNVSQPKKSTNVMQPNQRSTNETQANQRATNVTQAKQKSSKVTQHNQRDISSASSSQSSSDTSYLGAVFNLLSRTMARNNHNYYADKIASNPPPLVPVITNLNGLLADIYVRYVQIKRDDFQRHYSVFDAVFQYLHKTMKEVDLYYGKYSSMAQFAGSHYDNLRIKSADEFDMDIVIGLCLNLKECKINKADSDLLIEHQSPGFVQLKGGTQFQKLPFRDREEWLTNQTAYKWTDDCNYLLRSKFIDWFKSTVNKALNTLPKQNNNPVFFVSGVPYEILKSESGPSMTLFIVNKKKGFKLDVDLVPCLKFPEARWPPTPRAYRAIPAGCEKGVWMVVGKPDKAAPSHHQARSWRIALHYQERVLFYDLYNMKTTLRLTKALRDALGMKKIASYYIKTLFLFEVVERNNRDFWRASPAELFKIMVERLHKALVDQNIPYFWNNNNNLLKGVDSGTLFTYAASLVPLIQILNNPGGDNYKKVAKFLLTKPQFDDYNAKFLRIASLL